MLKLSGDMETIITPFLNMLNITAPHVEIIDASYLLGTMRFVKTPFEIKIKNAADVSTSAYYETLNSIYPE